VQISEGGCSECRTLGGEEQKQSLSQRVPMNPAPIERSLKQPRASRSVQVAGVVLEGRHLDPAAQRLDLQILEVVVLVILDDDVLQFTDFPLHPGPQLSLHLQQSL